jgi:biotin/methionine sulfoxide reductase
MPQLIPPVGQARDDYAIFTGLAERLGVGGEFAEGRDAAAWIAQLYQGLQERGASVGVAVPSLEDLRAMNWVKLDLAADEQPKPVLRRFRADPEGAALKTPSGKIEIFSERIDSFGYADCPGHPVWLPPKEWPGAATAEAPLHLVSPQPGDKLHSQLEAALADVDGARPETILIHEQDATARGIATGDLVRVFNARGAVRARAKVTGDILQGVVALPTGTWVGGPGQNIDMNGNPNVLTRDVGTSRLGQGTSAHSALVEVARL